VRIFGANSTTANFVATASRDGFCRIHDLRRPLQPVMRSLVPENRGFTSVDLSPDGRWLLAAPNTTGLQVMDAYTGHTVLKLAKAHSDVVSCLRVNAGNGKVCTGGDDQQLVLWQLERPCYW
jgi:WD40 repeat protein